MSQITKLAAVVGLTLASTSAFSATWVADARGNAMGNTGVTTADFLLAPFYNPALTAVYRDEDDFGLLLPAINVSARDTDETLSTLDDMQDVIDSFEDGGSTDNTQAAQINSYLTDLSDNSALNVSVGATSAIAMPIDMLSANIFARGYVEIAADTTIAADGGNTATAVEARYQASTVDFLAFGYSELGVALAKQFDVDGQKIALGLTPKVQKMVTYYQSVDAETAEIDDFDENEKSKSAFNFDLGAVWLVENYRLGVAVKDIISQTIDTYDGSNSYKLNPQVTLSAGYVSDYFTAAFDIDATKQERFEGGADDTQFIRFGIEGNAWGWAQLRAGYEMDMKDTVDNSITAGIGISPGDVVSIDLAGTYAGENQFGAALNLAFTF